jgi:hypothetical protein
MVHLCSQSEDYFYERKEDVKKWFKIKDVYRNTYLNKLDSLGIKLDENTCVINFRGGEYLGVPNLVPSSEYWNNSIKHMIGINPNMKFIIVTDDVANAKRFIGDYPCYHIDIGTDYFLVNQSMYSIIPPSSFSWWASWLNENSKLIIAPKYWARYNVSNGYWSCGDSYTRGFMFMDKNGNLEDYETCKQNALTFYEKIHNI